MMSTQTDTFTHQLTHYDLSLEESTVYLHLLKNTFCTALLISRDLHLGRTKVYRILDRLAKINLVEEKLGDRGQEFGAASPQRLQQLATEKEQAAKDLAKNSQILVNQLEGLMPNTLKKSKVLYYEGKEGLKQVTYNTVHTKSVMRVYEVAHMSDFLDTDFSERIRQKYVENKIFTRDVTNKKSFQAFTNVAQYIKKHSEFRYISPQLLDIQFESLVYNDVYATYTYSGSEIFCVEIYNEQLAKMQKQLFDFIWAQATKLTFMNMQGATKIEG